MSPQLQKLEKEALLLSSEEREHLVERLLQSLRDSNVVDLDPAWLKESERRYRELKSGQVKAIPGDHVFDQIRQELGWRS